VHHRQIDCAFDVEAEAPPGQMLAQHRLAAGLSPQVAEHQVGADALTSQFRQFTAVEAGQHDSAAGVPGGGGDQAVEQAGVFDLVAPAERSDDALDMASALADVLDEVEVLVAADLLDTDEHGRCLGSQQATTANLRESSALALTYPLISNRLEKSAERSALRYDLSEAGHERE
jgi:hypothetical protein